ncbi:MAG TPA: ABC transporter permease [Candidatus Fraserbacteria bacterium]|nr:ABC transporter permease [Candidatus Fraserbacteria bacterium]
MAGYLLRRLLQSVVVLFSVSLISFVIFQYLGDPIRTNYNPQELTRQRVVQLRRELGLDQPFYLQYAHWLERALHGDFGLSYRQRLPVMQLILERAPATLELATLALFSGTLLGLLLGIWSALHPRSLSAKSAIVTSLLGISTPTFVVGLLLILLFSVSWHWLPPFGRGTTVSLGAWRSGLFTLSGWQHLIMPVITLGLFQVGVMARLTRSGMLEVLAQDYVRTAWAKGLSSTQVVGKHALRNVLIPVITVLGMSYGELIAFSIVTESIFQWPGLGNLLLHAVFSSDQPIVVAYIVLTSLLILSLNLVVDLLYVALNPRIRYG